MEADLPSQQRAKKAGVTILVSEKTDVKPTKIKRDKERLYIMVKGAMKQEELTNPNIYAPNTETLRYIKQVLDNQKETQTPTQEQWETLTLHCHYQTDQSTIDFVHRIGKKPP